MTRMSPSRPSVRVAVSERSRELLAEIRRRVEAGETQASVAKHYELTGGQVNWLLRVAGYVPPDRFGAQLPVAEPKVETTRRPCLGCQRDFDSEGRHNRLCTTCRHPSGLSRQYEAASL